MAHVVDLIFEWTDSLTGETTGLVHESNTPDYIYTYTKGKDLKPKLMPKLKDNVEPLGVYYCKESRHWNTVSYSCLLYTASTEKEQQEILDYFNNRYRYLLDIKKQIQAIKKMGNMNSEIEQLKKEYRNNQIINLDLLKGWKDTTSG